MPLQLRISRLSTEIFNGLCGVEKRCVEDKTLSFVVKLNALPLLHIEDIIEIVRPHMLTDDEVEAQHAIAETIFEKGLEEINRGELPKRRR